MDGAREMRRPHASELHGSEVVEPVGEPRRKRSWRWVGRLAGLTLIGATFGFVIVLLLKFADGPAVGTQKPVPRPSLRVAPGVVSGTSLIGGPEIELTYPAMFDTMAQLKTDGEAIERYMLSSKTNYRRSVAVSVRPLPSGLLEDDSGYRFRQLHTAQFRETTERIGGDMVATMTRLDQHEQTYFWLHEGKILTVAVVSTDTKDDVAAIGAALRKGTRWRK